jgi:flagellar hook protein FlgE
MIGAIYIGLSGMDAYSRGLQQISNNVANLNTAGFKTSSLQFSDLFYNGSTSSDMMPTPGGGQYGTGVSFAGSMVNYSQGDIRSSTGNLDMAIQGRGFLVLLDGTQQLYTRTGQFWIDKDGFIIEQQSGHKLALIDSNGNVSAMSIAAKHASPPKPTTKIVFADNLSSGATDFSIPNIQVFDSVGKTHTWTLQFHSEAATMPGKWTVTVKDENDLQVDQETLQFIGSIADPTANTLTINFTPSGAAAQSVVLDFSQNVTSYAGGTSTLSVASKDGYALGALTDVTVTDKGEIQIAYSNGQTDKIGSVALADFQDLQSLKQQAGGLFKNETGTLPRILASEQNGVGKIVGKSTEASNVDLSQEFGELILVQRGYQASSQVVSIANDMIQQLFAIRNQA